MTWLTVMEYICHKWPLVVSTSRPFSHSWLITGFVTRLTRRVPLVEQELLILPEHLSSPPVFSAIRVARSLVWYVCFVDRRLSFCTFSLLSMLLYVLLWYTDSNFPFGIFTDSNFPFGIFTDSNFPFGIFTDSNCPFGIFTDSNFPFGIFTDSNFPLVSSQILISPLISSRILISLWYLHGF